jgi:hypothetical protein
MTNKKIDSAAEPWILLPFVNTIKEKGILAKYNHNTCYNAFQDFISNIGGRQAYFSEIRKFTLNLYMNLSKKSKSEYFIDKTPRYYLIIPEISKIFPNAKFIFLFRNPLDVYSSILETWHKNSFLTFHGHFIDLFEGPKYLADGYMKIKSKSLLVNYERLIKNPESVILKISNYLELNYSDFKLDKFKHQNLRGKMGDRVGINKYSDISSKSIEKWKNNFNTFFRKKYALNYINLLNEEYLFLSKYKREYLIDEIKSVKVKYFGITDFLEANISNLYRVVKLKFQVQNHLELLNRNKEKSLYF